jgi:hypothetical protein
MYLVGLRQGLFMLAELSELIATFKCHQGTDRPQHVLAQTPSPALQVNKVDKSENIQLRLRDYSCQNSSKIRKQGIEDSPSCLICRTSKPRKCKTKSTELCSKRTSS